MDRVGIDLGTTNTVIASRGEVLALSSAGERILPSVVAFPPTGTPLVGGLARRRRPIDPKNTVFSSKRLIGRHFASDAAARFAARYPLALGPVGTWAGFRTRVGDITPIEVAAHILTEGCVRAEIDPAQSCAVIAVPVVFAAEPRAGTVAAARQAGFAEVELIDEPEASARAFVTAADARPRYVVTYDFGGGTFDVAVIDCTTGFRMLGYAGDLYLGGDEIDEALAEWVTAEVLRMDRWDLHSDPQTYARLVAECERAKIRLCADGAATVELTQVDLAYPGAARGVPLAGDVVSQLTFELVRRTFVLCDEALAVAGVRVSEIEAVYLAGGTTLLPMIRRGVAGYFGQPALCHLDPIEVVAVGASLAAP